VRVGFDGRFLSERPSGNGVFTRSLLDGLAALDDGVEYTVYGLHDAPPIQCGGTATKRMPALHSLAQARFLATFPIELYRNRVDVFQAFYTVPIRTFAPVVLYMIEIGWITGRDVFPMSPLRIYQMRLTTSYSVRKADRIVIPTQFWRDRLLEQFDVPEEKIHVISPGINEAFLERCHPEELDQVRKRYSIFSEYILSVGDLHPRKNLGRLIEAFSWLKEKHSIPHDLVLVGKDSWQADRIRRQVASLSTSTRNSIVFTGYVADDDLRALYQGADAFVFPTLDEGIGLPAHEAMASQVPVVASHAGALPEIVGDAALLVDPLSSREIADAVLRLLESPSLRSDLVARGLRQIEGFTWPSACRKVVELYADVSR